MYRASENARLSEVLFENVEEICLSVDAGTRGRTKPLLKEAWMPCKHMWNANKNETEMDQKNARLMLHNISLKASINNSKKRVA